MSRFTTHLDIRDTDVTIDGRPVFRTLEPFSFEMGAEGSGHFIHVPAGFETDFASVPRFLWRLFPPWGEYRKAAVLHDYLYRTESGFTKWLGDSLFYEAMVQLKVPWWKRRLIYYAVSWFGYQFYNWKATAPPGTSMAMLEPRTGDLKEEFKLEKETQNA